MNYKKGFRYYGFVFAMSTLAIVIFLAVNSFQGADISATYILSILTVPFVFTTFLFIFDRIIDAIFNRKKKQEVDLYEAFLLEATNLLKETGEFDIEDFKKFRNNVKFQRVLKILFRIKEHGETTDANYKMVEKRFKKDTKEQKAIEYLMSR